MTEGRHSGALLTLAAIVSGPARGDDFVGSASPEFPKAESRTRGRITRSWRPASEPALNSSAAKDAGLIGHVERAVRPIKHNVGNG